MKYSTRLSDAVHVLALLALSPEGPISSDAIAQSVHTNPSYIRQLMSALRKSGLILSVKGRPHPVLARNPCLITLLDVYRAVEGDKPLLHQDANTDPACHVGIAIQLALRDCYDLVQKKAEETMQTITLQEILERSEEKRHL